MIVGEGKQNGNVILHRPGLSHVSTPPAKNGKSVNVFSLENNWYFLHMPKYLCDCYNEENIKSNGLM